MPHMGDRPSFPGYEVHLFKRERFNIIRTLHVNGGR